MAKLKRVGLVLLIPLWLLCFLGACANNDSTAIAGKINVVAAENFYGDVAKQVGGEHVNVTSILSDPEVDPHEYESNVANGMAVAKAQLIIKNGGGYDEWMDKLISASPNDDRSVVTGFDIASSKLPDNEHIWYSPENMRAVAKAIADALKKQDATHASDYDNNLKTFDNSLQQITQKLNEIKGKYAGTPVGLTETIYLYQTGPMGLDVKTPEEFQKAVAEGNDPPASSVATANNQVTKGEIKVLIYNEQTVTPITTKLQQDALAHNIPIVPVTETMPKNKTYQGWMLDQLSTLTQALKTAMGK
ncbi:metal ABC transporter solute-binding protein, Zn/Mn family [Ktedonospora formicarum]|uniref:ABC transporter substrate-binding protein n=1 Tax=Ktedonospora formicarum TaxID=2778364 RepID=A0A8J3MRK4_9CHLR|nr:zinc ABC transporter substrate-binding protein [Ktedonospora formicarum]GHO46152.1 ABC transporter substrate-binding protein [Ktedonospora formicarum]